MACWRWIDSFDSRSDSLTSSSISHARIIIFSSNQSNHFGGPSLSSVWIGWSISSTRLDAISSSVNNLLLDNLNLTLLDLLIFFNISQVQWGQSFYGSLKVALIKIRLLARWDILLNACQLSLLLLMMIIYVFLKLLESMSKFLWFFLQCHI